MPRKYKSKIAASMHRTVAGLYRIGNVDQTTMREFDRTCLTKPEVLQPKDIRAIRKQAGVSQAVFAEHLGVTTGLISKWECGDKKPSRMAIKMLTLVKTKGLDVIA
jgi:putative transcriptional regulator